MVSSTVYAFVALSLLAFTRYRNPNKIPTEEIKQNNDTVNQRKILQEFSSPAMQQHLGVLRTMLISPENFEKLLTPEVQEMKRVFHKFGHSLRVVGGAVRDLLQGRDYTDIDFATSATIKQMETMFKSENIRVIAKNWRTLTIGINKTIFEVSPLKRIVTHECRLQETSDEWHRDALHRDFTINAMSMDFDGLVYDYFNGADDLEKKIVRFVGEPVNRIREDYRTIIRYFRFYGQMSSHPDSHDASVLQAIQQNAHGLSHIPDRRLRQSLKEIMCGRHAFSILQRMSKLGVTQYLGLSNSLTLSTRLHKNCDIEPTTCH